VCTLTIAWQVFPDTPVAVVANRDESYDRPSVPPARVETDPMVVAPRDEEAGGTWIGYNEHGLFAGVTNRWVDADLAGDRSRGLLVRDALRHPDAETAVRAVERTVADHEYEGFNLVLASATAAFLLEWDGRLSVRQFDPGVHVVVNVGAADATTIPAVRQEYAERQAENARRVHERLVPEPGESVTAWLDRATAVIRDHEYGVCVHGDGYGTVSSSVLAIGRTEDDEPVPANYRFADGPPCETPYEPVEEAGDERDEPVEEAGDERDEPVEEAGDERDEPVV
jgi:uncharacterized protein with NRDE domain